MKSVLLIAVLGFAINSYQAAAATNQVTTNKLVSVGMRPIHHLLAHDELMIAPVDECAGFNILNVTIGVEVIYPSLTRRLTVTQSVWNRTHPLVVSLPDEWVNVTCIHVVGQFGSLFTWKSGCPTP